VDLQSEEGLYSRQSSQHFGHAFHSGQFKSYVTEKPTRLLSTRGDTYYIAVHEMLEVLQVV